MTDNSVNDVLLFNEKAELLGNSSLAKAMRQEDSGGLFECSAEGDYEVVLVGAEGESVDAAFLTWRMFLQNNDRISIRNISKIYANSNDFSSHRTEFEAVRTQINNYLDSPNGIDFFGKNYTNREIIELLLYGSKGHSNREKEADLKTLMDFEPVANMFLNQVNAASANLVKGILLLAEINKKALTIISSQSV